MEYHYLMEENSVIVYDRIKNQQKKYYYPIEKELRIQSAIKAGNGKAAQEYISDVFDKNLNGESHVPELLRLQSMRRFAYFT